MKNSCTVKINFRGGIISPGDLHAILLAAENAGVAGVSFGLRQQLFIEVRKEKYKSLISQLKLLGTSYETDSDNHPNIVSSYPAEEVFITKTWLSEGVYKDIFDLIDYEPELKINISDSNQSFTPMLTGNINWVASLHSAHFWHLFIRFPKTNIIYEWEQLLYTNDIARMSRQIELHILKNPDKFYDNASVNGADLFDMIDLNAFIIKAADAPAQLPPFNLPYYEGLNRYNDKYWLGIYRRDEMFDINFLKDICVLCLQTKIGQVCSTSWKSLIIKGIEEKAREYWNALLAIHRVNVRHAANELNFQVEDNCSESLQLKSYLVKHLSRYDIRTFGVCIGIKTRKKSEIFSSILVKRKPLFVFAGIGFFYVYDILCAGEFNPNERTGFIFSRNTPKFLLPEKLRRVIISFYIHQTVKAEKIEMPSRKEADLKHHVEYVHQCPHCFTTFEQVEITFEQLPDSYCCLLCEAPKKEFIKIDMARLLLQPV